MEEWKDVVGYEGYYQVSNLGNVRSIDRIVDGLNGRRFFKGITLKQNKDNYGYCIVSLYKERKPKTCKVHRLVADAFIENVNDKSTINHIDGNKENNSVENLEWLTQEENFQHAIKEGLYKTKLTDEQVLYIKNKYIPHDKEYSRVALANKFGVSKGHIGRIVQGKSRIV